MRPRRVYLDYNATAPVRPEVRRAVEPILFGAPEEGWFGNASSVHWAGQAARKTLESARARVARLTGRRPSEVIFTSGGTEADNLALFGVALSQRAHRGRIVISEVEHPALLAAAHRLERAGHTVVRVGVDARGVLDLDALERALDAPTALVSVMAVNNETGVVSPIDEVIARAHPRGALVHVDAVQAAGRIPLPFAADLISLSGHKLGGLKGSGLLLTRESIPLEPQILGGPQERGHRAGTEAVASALALAVALEEALAHASSENSRLRAERDRLEAALRALPGVRIAGLGAIRVDNTTCALFEGVEGDAVLQSLDLAGIAASSGSACSSGSLEPSHVLLAMGVPPKEALSAVRFSMGPETTPADIDQVVDVLPAIVTRARAASI